jgi:hypothetical protein
MSADRWRRIATLAKSKRPKLRASVGQGAILELDQSDFRLVRITQEPK